MPYSFKCIIFARIYLGGKRRGLDSGVCLTATAPRSTEASGGGGSAKAGLLRGEADFAFGGCGGLLNFPVYLFVIREVLRKRIRESLRVPG